ncbi:hypothetical protein BGX29_004175, partial [Mortierella sp. GBA35]
LVLLRLELDKQARTSGGETLRSIVEDDIGKFSGHRVVTMVAPSGSGKTATVIDLATRHFVVYCVCCSPDSAVSLDFKDSNFITLAREVERIYRTIIDKEQGGLRATAVFREQTTGGASTIAKLVYKLRDYDISAIHAMLREVQTKLHTLLVPRRLGLVIALDEAQAAVTGILSGKIISPSALVQNQDILLDHKNQIKSQFRRGFLTPLSATLSNIQATLVILGTTLSLQDADHVYSARRKLSGRARFSIGIVNRLVTTGLTQDSKQATLDNAINYTIEHVMSGLRSGIRTILDSDKTGASARLLCQMVLAYRLYEGKISFSSDQESDFVDTALCRLQKQPDGIHLIMDEPMVVEAVQEELKASGKDPAFTEYLDQIYQIVTNFGVASSSKGNALEPLIRRSLQRFNGVRLVDLPFLQGIALPKWCDDFQLQIDDVKTANGFGYKGIGVAADLAFLTDGPPSNMLVANSGTRPDGVWFFPEKRYAGSLAVKLYSSP